MTVLRRMDYRSKSRSRRPLRLFSAKDENALSRVLPAQIKGSDVFVKYLVRKGHNDNLMFLVLVLFRDVQTFCLCYFNIS